MLYLYHQFSQSTLLLVEVLHIIAWAGGELNWMCAGKMALEGGSAEMSATTIRRPNFINHIALRHDLHVACFAVTPLAPITSP